MKNKKESEIDIKAVAEELKNLLQDPNLQDLNSTLESLPREIIPQEREYYEKAYDVYLKTVETPQECGFWLALQVSDLQQLFNKLSYSYISSYDDKWPEVVKTFLQTVPEEILYEPRNCQSRRNIDGRCNFEELYPSWDLRM